MKNETPKKYQRWEKTRQKGKQRFILINGALMLGGWMLIFTNIIDYFTEDNFDIFKQLFSAWIWPVGGLIWGYIVWDISENKYQTFLDQLKKSQTPINPEHGQAQKGIRGDSRGWLANRA